MDIFESSSPPENANANRTPTKELSQSSSNISQGLANVTKQFLSWPQFDVDINHKGPVDYSQGSDISGGHTETTYYSMANDQWPPKLNDSSGDTNEFSIKEETDDNELLGEMESSTKESFKTSSLMEITEQPLYEIDAQVVDDLLSDDRHLKGPTSLEDHHSEDLTRCEDQKSRESFGLEDRRSKETIRFEKRRSRVSIQLEDQKEPTRFEDQRSREPVHFNQRTKEITRSNDSSSFVLENPSDRNDPQTFNDESSDYSSYDGSSQMSESPDKKWFIEMGNNQNYIRALINYDINYDWKRSGKRKIEKTESATKTRWVIHYDNLNYIRSLLSPEALGKVLKEESNKNTESNFSYEYREVIVHS
ncbi:uncharacterized protein NPIL_383481 [Nephila pilipes]|uniref:Uncharacterized protein n=1 Tax=Nephila pilipes TaxID=299642 RepID=A0A8X6PBZ1_NEPPI|nr:uncharacterized protein NPIL_383481 [Nephila pilipes]